MPWLGNKFFHFVSICSFYGIPISMNNIFIHSGLWKFYFSIGAIHQQRSTTPPPSLFQLLGSVAVLSLLPFFSRGSVGRSVADRILIRYNKATKDDGGGAALTDWLVWFYFRQQTDIHDKDRQQRIYLSRNWIELEVSWSGRKVDSRWAVLDDPAAWNLRVAESHVQ